MEGEKEESEVTVGYFPPRQADRQQQQFFWSKILLLPPPSKLVYGGPRHKTMLFGLIKQVATEGIFFATCVAFREGCILLEFPFFSLAEVDELHWMLGDMIIKS